MGNSLCIKGIWFKLVATGMEQCGKMSPKRKLEDDLDNLSTESSESEEDVEGDNYPSNEQLNPTLQLIERARLQSLLKQKEMVDSFGLSQPCRLFPPSALMSTTHPAKKKAKKVDFCLLSI